MGNKENQERIWDETNPNPAYPAQPETRSRSTGGEGKQEFPSGCGSHGTAGPSSCPNDPSNPLTGIPFSLPPSHPGSFAAQTMKEQKASLARLHPAQGHGAFPREFLPHPCFSLRFPLCLCCWIRVGVPKSIHVKSPGNGAPPLPCARPG